MVSSSLTWRGPQLFTIREACDLLRIGRTKLYDGARKGTIKLTKLDGCSRVSSTEIERIISENTVQAAA